MKRHSLYDYIIGYNDNHADNYLIKDNRLIAIDKNPSFTEGTGKGNTTKWSPPFFTSLFGGGNFQFSRSEVEHMADVAGRIAANLEKQGMGKYAVGVRSRAEVLRGLLHMYGAMRMQSNSTISDWVGSS